MPANEREALAHLNTHRNRKTASTAFASNAGSYRPLGLVREGNKKGPPEGSPKK